MTDLEVTPCTGTHTGHNISSGAQNFLGVQITSGNSLIGETISSLQVALGKEGAGSVGNVTATHQRGSTITTSSTTIPYSNIDVWSLPNTLHSFSFNITIEENDYFWITSDNLTNRCGVDYYDTCPNYTGFDSKKKSGSGTIDSLAGQLRSVWTYAGVSSAGTLLPPPVAWI
jgi:hypothetical protein